ncbi:hypothetical protein Mgra_00001553, partial [Meloidogyne graminicola]
VFTGINISLINNPTKLVTCSTSDPVPSFVFQIVVYFNLISLLFYIILWIIMNKKFNSTNNSSKRMLKSILAVFFLEFFGWFINTLIRNITIWLQISQLPTWYIMQIAGCLLVPILSFYTPLLYIISNIYSNAFYKCFGIYFPFSTKDDLSIILNENKIKTFVEIQRKIIPAKTINF